MSPERTERLKQDRDRAMRFLPKYRPEMIETCKEILKQGGTVAMCAAACDVSKEAIQKWRQPHSPHFQVEFWEMWQVAAPKFEAYHDQTGLNELEKPRQFFNDRLYNMFRKNNTDWSEFRKLDFPTLANPDLTAKEMRQELGKLLKENQINAQEFNYLAKTFSDLMNLEEVDKLRNEVEELKLLIKKGNLNEAQIDSESA